MDKGKGGSSGADEEGYVKVKRKKSGGNNEGNKNFKPVSVKLEPQYRPKAKQSTDGANQKTTPSVGKKNVSTSGNDSFSLFEALNVENSVSEEVETGNKGFISGVEEEGQNFTPLVEKINMFEIQMLDRECVLVDDDNEPQKKVNHSGDQDSKDETEFVNNEMTSYLASKPSRVRCGTKSLLEQWRETYVNDDYDPYDDDMYEGHDIHDNIQSMCDNLDIKVRGRMKK
ncbi:hypothetical protein Tco_0586987 [Tanacetum coccineum]